MGFNLYSIAAENPFLRVLARWLLNDVAKQAPLSRTTVLVPNRRSARALEAVLLQESGQNAMLLPIIKPIGDIDEDVLADSLPAEGVPDALPKAAHLHAILDLLMQWAKSNPNVALTEDVVSSGAQAFALAQSLQQLVNQFETEDVEIEKLQGFYDLEPDLAGHRQNILELLKVIITELPKRLAIQNLIGPSARRNQMIRLEAKRITLRQHQGPIIAAGSTGTNPATRDLLRAIALDPRGTVILPGLDLELDEAAWNTITSEHPQFSLKSMLDQWNVKRSDIQVLGEPQSRRMWLMGQALRPAEVAEHWNELLHGKQNDIAASLNGVELVEADDRQQEVEVIALAFRRHVETSSAKAALMTSDRDLATRVKEELKRWNLDIDDSAGELLLHKGRAALFHLLLQTIEQKFSASSLFALLYHADCCFGMPRSEHLTRVRALELIAYRGMPEAQGLHQLVERIAKQKTLVKNHPHVHPLLKSIREDDWLTATKLAAELDATLSPLADGRERSLYDHIENLSLCLDLLSPPSENLAPADQLCVDILTTLKQSSMWHPLLPLTKTQHSILHALSQETLRPPFNPNSQLAIYGLAEARLVDVDLLILGGLVEGSWPARPESGPWLNRTMRDVLKLQQPERDIGVTAHDFVQGFCHPKVAVTWPKRLAGAPVLVSRWVLRLQAVATASGLDAKQLLSTELKHLAQLLDVPSSFSPVKVPRPTPPVSVRPNVFSVTRIEKLIRDSYHVYAEQILKLQPLEKIGHNVDARLRGTLIHQALHEWAKALPQVPASEHLHLLLLKGREAFEPYFDMPEVQQFWWMRFIRMASEFIERNATFDTHRIVTRTEVDGRLEIDVAGVRHQLKARADRIDILDNGDVRIIDYKSGVVPTLTQIETGFAPQLPLEALIATDGQFKNIVAHAVDDVIYIAVGGTSDGVKITKLSETKDLSSEIENARVGLLKLLGGFQSTSTPYIPRHNLQNEEAKSDYDHLSRKLEWQLEGTAS